LTLLQTVLVGLAIGLLVVLVDYRRRIHHVVIV